MEMEKEKDKECSLPTLSGPLTMMIYFIYRHSSKNYYCGLKIDDDE